MKLLSHRLWKRNEKNWSGASERQGSSWSSIMNDLVQNFSLFLKLGRKKKANKNQQQALSSFWCSFINVLFFFYNGNIWIVCTIILQASILENLKWYIEIYLFLCSEIRTDEVSVNASVLHFQALFYNLWISMLLIRELSLHVLS